MLQVIVLRAKGGGDVPASRESPGAAVGSHDRVSAGGRRPC
jgi:hypothetical protein